jgi:peptidoglycan/LPS O-acetylase OafA/YrhL
MWSCNGWRIIVLTLVGVLAVIADRAHFVGSYAAVTCLVGYLVVLFSRRIPVPEILLSYCNALGGISYPLYLFHFPLWIVLYSQGFGGQYLYYLASIIFVSLVMYYFFEGFLVRKLFRLSA